MLSNLDAGFERFTSFRDEIAGKLSLLDEIQEDECTFGVEHQSFDALDRARTNLNAMERIYERRSLFHAQLPRRTTCSPPISSWPSCDPACSTTVAPSLPRFQKS